MKLNRKSIKFVVVLLLLTVVNFLVPINKNLINASTEGSSEKVEAILKEIINEYGIDNIIFEDGIVIDEKEEVSLDNLSEYSAISWKSKDSSIIEINNNNLIGLSSGTTFLIGKHNDKYHIKEVYVQSNLTTSNFEVSNYNLAAARRGYVVYLDPGHGGSDPGAIANGVREKDLNLEIALGVRKRLENIGVTVYMSRETDKFVSLQDIVNGANSIMPDAFISIHQNSFGNPSVNGIETYWYKTNVDKELANNLQTELINNTKANNRGIKYDDYYVVKNTKVPSALIESGFISNVDEANRLKSKEYQNIIIDSIANGAYKFVRDNIDINALVAERIYGSNRYETSYKLFDKGWNSSQTAIIASGIDYPDALTATPLAGKYDAPILLSKNTTLDAQPELKSALMNKGVKEVIIVGGESAIPRIIQDQISALGINVRRIGGKDRYETSTLIANEVGVNNGEVALAYGLSFADGLSIASIAAKKQMPILLTRDTSIPDSTKNFLSSNNINKTYVVGSTTVISDNVVHQTPNPERLGGVNRYETNSKIFNRFKGELDLSTIYLASGLDFPDALSSSAIAAKYDSFVLLSNTRQVEGSIRDAIGQIKPNLNVVYVLGSNVVIPDNIVLGLNIDTIR